MDGRLKRSGTQATQDQLKRRVELLKKLAAQTNALSSPLHNKNKANTSPTVGPAKASIALQLLRDAQTRRSQIARTHQLERAKQVKDTQAVNDILKLRERLETAHKLASKAKERNPKLERQLGNHLAAQQSRTPASESRSHMYITDSRISALDRKQGLNGDANNYKLVTTEMAVIKRLVESLSAKTRNFEGVLGTYNTKLDEVIKKQKDLEIQITTIKADKRPENKAQKNSAKNKNFNEEPKVKGDTIDAHKTELDSAAMTQEKYGSECTAPRVDKTASEHLLKIEELENDLKGKKDVIRVYEAQLCEEAQNKEGLERELDALRTENELEARQAESMFNALRAERLAIEEAHEIDTFKIASLCEANDRLHTQSVEQTAEAVEVARKLTDSEERCRVLEEEMSSLKVRVSELSQANESSLADVESLENPATAETRDLQFEVTKDDSLTEKEQEAEGTGIIKPSMAKLSARKARSAELEERCKRERSLNAEKALHVQNLDDALRQECERASDLQRSIEEMQTYETEEISIHGLESGLDNTTKMEKTAGPGDSQRSIEEIQTHDQYSALGPPRFEEILEKFSIHDPEPSAALTIKRK